MGKDETGFDDPTVFAGPQGTQRSAQKAKLICVDESLHESLKDLAIVLDNTEQTIGRGAQNTVCIKYKQLSRQHARVLPEVDTWLVEDLNSTNGVYVNDERVKKARLKHGDIVKIGTVPFRYIVERPAVVAHGNPPGGDTLNTQSTMYAGHLGVLGSLARPDESLKEEEREETGEKPIRVSAVASKRIKRSDKSISARKPIARYLLWLLVTAGLLGGGYFYWQVVIGDKIEALVAEYEGDFRRFIDSYEIEGVRFSKHANEIELSEIRNMAARVDVAANTYPESAGLKVLQAKLLFLEFERKLNGLLQQGEVLDGQELVGQTRNELDSFIKGTRFGGDDKRAVQDVVDLLELAEVITRFKLFKQRFPDPATANPDLIRPATHDMREMRDLKDALVRTSRKIHLPLSVTYAYFKRMVDDVDENDVRLVNRWREVLKKEGKL